MSLLFTIHPIRLLKLLFNADRYYSEELFASVFRKLGPVVAIGQPGEWLATPGADKMYVHESEWKQVVLDYLAKCRVVILQPSKSKGVRWEVAQVLRGVPLERVLLSLSNFHGNPDEYKEFRLMVREQTNVDLPPEIPAFSTPALVYFEADGTPIVQQVCYRSPLLWPFVASGVDEQRTFDSFLRRLEGKPNDGPALPQDHLGQKPLSVLLTFTLFFGLIGAVVLCRPIIEAVKTGRLLAAPKPDLSVPYTGKGVKYQFSIGSQWKILAPSSPKPGQMVTEYELSKDQVSLFYVGAINGLIMEFKDLPWAYREYLRRMMVQNGAKITEITSSTMKVMRDGEAWTELTFSARSDTGKLHCRVQIFNTSKKSIILFAVVPDTQRDRDEVERIMNSFHFVNEQASPPP